MSDSPPTHREAHRYLSRRPETFLTDAIAGFVAAHDDIGWESDPGFLHRTDAGEGVALVSGGGSGHEPMHAGLIGAGMLDAACPGLIFTSPNALQIAAATRRVDRGVGVVHIVKNYTGDVMNFSIARRLVADDVATDHVLIDDDVATESADGGGPGRRGTGATVIVEKVCGAAAARGDDLASVAALGRRVAAGARSFSVAFAPCTVPGSDRTSFDLAPHEMEFGVGIHGEAGVERVAQLPADELVSAMLDRILASLAAPTGASVIAFVNGLGSTHPLELNVVFDQVVRQVTDRGLEVTRSVVGTLVTALDMAGFSITLVRCDDEIVELFDAPTRAPAWPAHTSTRPAMSHEVTFAEPRDAADDGDEVAWVGAFVERIQQSIDELTDLDRRAGDGDFGSNMAAALNHFDLPLRGSETDVLRAVSTSFLVRAGGTSGAVFGTLFAELATAFGEAGSSSDALRVGTVEALRQIGELGGARVGDNTLVDALAPAAEALERGGSPDDVAAAAENGAESTRDLVAARGRASYVGDRARGVVDPGALVVGWLFRAAADHAATDQR